MTMKTPTLLAIWCMLCLIVQDAASTIAPKVHHEYKLTYKKDTSGHIHNDKQLKDERIRREVEEVTDVARDRRDVIEEEKFYNVHANNNLPSPWIPGPLPPEDPTTKVSLTIGETDDKNIMHLYPTTEKSVERPTGRGARASNENWIKLPFPARDEEERDNILTPPQPSGELLKSRMPRVDFVTQNKQLETSESRNDKETIQRTSRNNDIRTEFVRPDENDHKPNKPLYPRQALYPEETRRYYDDRYNIPRQEEYFRREPYYDSYDRRRLIAGNYYPQAYGARVDRYDEPNEGYVPRKPKRIIYYAHLPEVVRAPPSVDLRYRYSVDPYRRPEEEYSARGGRYDYRFRNRYPYMPLRREDRLYRDLAGAATNKDKKSEEKVTAAPVLPPKDDTYKVNLNTNRNNPSRNVINSHQYHDSVNVHYTEPLTHKNFHDGPLDDGYYRYDNSLYQSSVIDPYQDKY